MPSFQGKQRGSVSIDIRHSKVVTASTDIAVDKILSVAFNEDVNIITKEGNSVLPFTYALPAGIWLDFNDSTTAVTVDVDCNMFAMGR